MTLTEALELFKADYIALRGLVGSTEENYSLAVLSFCRAIGDKEISDIQPRDLLAWRRWMEKRNKTSTIRGYMSKLKNILIFTNKKGLTNFDISEIFLPKLPPPLPKYLSPEEITLLIQTAGENGRTQEHRYRNQCLLAFLFSSGLRASELSMLKKSDIDGCTVYVRQGKGNTARTVFMSLEARGMLDKYLKIRKDKSEVLFYSHKGKGYFSHDTLNHCIKKIAEQAGLGKDIHTHMLRHSYATHLVKSGVDVAYVQRMMGHAFINTTQIYIHLSNNDLQIAHEKVFNQ